MYQAKHTAKAKMKQRKRSNSVFQAAGILMITMMLSRVLGFVRVLLLPVLLALARRPMPIWLPSPSGSVYFALVGGALARHLFRFLVVIWPRKKRRMPILLPAPF